MATQTARAELETKLRKKGVLEGDRRWLAERELLAARRGRGDLGHRPRVACLKATN